jgi:tetratricopeptide (TPR) repeat protein
MRWISSTRIDRMRPHLAFALFMLSLAWAGRVCAAGAENAAGPPAVPAVAEARTRYERGVEAYRLGRYAEAVELFRQADALAPSAPLSFNIARAYAKLGDASGALRWYRDYLRRAPRAPNAAEAVEQVRLYEDVLRQRGVQQLTVLSNPPSATVAVDGVPMGVTPWTGDLPPGRHRVDIVLRGFADESREFELAADRARDVWLELRALPKEPPARSTSTGEKPSAGASKPDGARSSKRFGIWPYVTLGAGAAALGGAVAFEFLRQESEDRAARDERQISFKSKIDEMESRRTTATILLGVGSVLVVGGGVMLAVDLLTPSPETQARLAIGAGPQGPGVSAYGSF